MNRCEVDFGFEFSGMSILVTNMMGKNTLRTSEVMVFSSCPSDTTIAPLV